MIPALRMRWRQKGNPEPSGEFETSLRYLDLVSNQTKHDHNYCDSYFGCQLDGIQNNEENNRPSGLAWEALSGLG